MHRSIGAQWNNIFLGQRLDAVGDGLQQAKRPDAIGPDAILDTPKPLALKDRRQGKERRKDANDGNHTKHDAAQRLPGRG